MREIYYVEDDAGIGGMVKAYLEGKGFQVTVLPTAAEARLALQRHLPEIVLLDWNLPDGGGDSLCRWIRGSWEELPVIFLTVRGDGEDIVKGLLTGADDYVVKPFSLDVLYSRIQALLRRAGSADRDTGGNGGANGRGNFGADCLSCGGIILDLRRRRVFLSDAREREISLSETEYQVLLYLMENKERTVSRERILEQVWDVKGSYVNDNTLTVTIKRLREKLGQPSCLKTVRSVGYRMEDRL